MPSVDHVYLNYELAGICKEALVRQATQSCQRLREILGAHLFRAWCSANVSNWTYADAPNVSEVEPEDDQCPSEETVRRLLPGTTEEDKTREGFDYCIYRLLWPRRDLTALSDLARLVTIFKTVLKEGGQRKARLYIDLLYSTGASSANDPEGSDPAIGRLRYRDRLWTASQMADIILETV